MSKARCSQVVGETELCFKPAVQRVLLPQVITHRCKDHKLTVAEAKKLNVRVFDMERENNG